MKSANKALYTVSAGTDTWVGVGADAVDTKCDADSQ